jgi:putative ABC transport system substrate-binding protein
MKVGILLGGSRKDGQQEVNQIVQWLEKECKEPLDIRVPDWDDNIPSRAKSLIEMNVAALLVTGGSMAAQAAIQSRGQAKAPIIIFTTVAQYIIRLINDTTITTGVCASTSDGDGMRLYILLEFLGYNQPKIGVLWNSSRTDTGSQWAAINYMAQGQCELVSGDIKGNKKMKDVFNLFQTEAVDGVLVAADPFFYKNMPEVIDRVNTLGCPAMYQWRDFVVKGGLMSHGANRDYCYATACQMLGYIQQGNPVPPVQYAPFELVVSQVRAANFNRFPLPPKFTGVIYV